MKKRVITALAVVFLLIGAVLLIAPRISNQIGKQEAQTAIEQFEELKRSIESTSAATNPTDETQPDKRDSKSGQAEVHGEVEHGVDTETRTVVYHIDADRLYRDSVAYNEKLKTHQYDLLINEHSYQKASLDLYDYGVPNNIYGYISATSIDMELPIYLGASEDKLMFENRSISILAYNTETILAEKLETVISRSTANTRLRDFYDLRILYDTVEIDYGKLKDAFSATSERRGSTSVVKNKYDVLVQLESDEGMKTLWTNYQRKFDYAKEYSWYDIMAVLRIYFDRL